MQHIRQTPSAGIAGGRDLAVQVCGMNAKDDNQIQVMRKAFEDRLRRIYGLTPAFAHITAELALGGAQ